MTEVGMAIDMHQSDFAPTPSQGMSHTDQQTAVTAQNQRTSRVQQGADAIAQPPGERDHLILVAQPRGIGCGVIDVAPRQDNANVLRT
jgi:hypothetical protein